MNAFFRFNPGLRVLRHMLLPTKVVAGVQIWDQCEKARHGYGAARTGHGTLPADTFVNL